MFTQVIAYLVICKCRERLQAIRQTLTRNLEVSSDVRRTSDTLASVKALNETINVSFTEQREATEFYLDFD